MFSDSTIQELRRLHQAAMMDECEILVYTPGGTDQYNMPEPDDYVYRATVPCSYRPVKADEAMETAEVPLLDGVIALDRGVEETYELVLRNLDRVRLTKLHGDKLTQPDLYEFAGPLKRDYVAIVIPVKQVTLEG